jgi:hypothetical protein
MKNIIFLLVIFLISQTAFGQTFRWAYSTGGELSDKAQQLVIDSSDKIYSVGLFNDTVDFNPGPGTTIFNNYGSADIYVTKSDTSGSLIWARQYANNSAEEVLNAAISGLQNLAMVGYFRDGMDANPSPAYTNYLVGPGFNSQPQICRLGLTPTGSYHTSFEQIGAAGNNLVDGGKGYGLAIDPYKGLYTTGFYRGTVDFADGPNVLLLSTPMPNYHENMYLYRQDSLGNRWAMRLGSNSYKSEGRSVASDHLGNCYLTGVFSGSINFNPYAFPSYFLSGPEDVPIAKYDTAANFLWARKVGGTGYDVGNDIKLDHDENVYITGSFENTVDFDPTAGVYNLQTSGPFQSDAFILKLDSSGNFLWARKIGGNQDDEGKKIVFDSYNNVYVLGLFRDTVNFDTDSGQHYYLGAPNVNNTRVFISKYSPAGAFQWTKAIEGSSSVIPGSIAIGKNNEIYINGGFLDTIDIDPGASSYYLSSNGSYDIFTLKLSDCGQHYSTQTFTACDSIIIDTNTYYSSGYYTHLYNTTQGCDSNVVYHVIINQPTANSILMTACDSITMNGQTYTNSGSYTQTFTNAQGCDSILTLQLTIHYTTSNTLTQTGCDSLNINGQTYINSGIYTQTLTNAQGCDSILTLNLTINHTTTQTLTQTACDSLTINAQTYTNSGTYTQMFTNNQGCDSILTLNLTINHSTTGSVTQTACDSLSINGQTYTSSGTYTQVLTNAQGCDSILTLNLTINHTTTYNLTQSGCDSLNINGQIYTSSGTYIQTLTNAQWCDSILTLNLTIKYSTNHTITQTACDVLTINGVNYTSSGTYIQVLTNAQGCDSILTINATINTVDNTVTQNANTLSSNETGAAYQWLQCNPYTLILGANNQNYMAIANGDYAVEVIKNGCTDTSLCIKLIMDALTDPLEIQGISLFPNPFNHIIHLTSDQPLSHADLQVYNVLGEVIYQNHKIVGTQFDIDLGNHAKGIYIVELKSAGKLFRNKVVKE